jgi:hypothetical protein
VNHAYTAGLLDGEGTIGINRTQADTYAIRVAVGMTDVAASIISGLQRSYGGRVNPMKPGGENHRPKLRWAVEGESAARVLEAVLPYLILKRGQAVLALELQERLQVWREESGRNFWNHARRHEAETFKQRLNEMNQRGVTPSEPPLLPGRQPVAVRRWGAWWEPTEDLFGPVPFRGKIPSSGSMQAGRIYPAEQPTEAASSPGLPTPRARGWKRGGKDGLEETLLPTPRTSDTNGAGGPDLRTAVHLLPTPRATDGSKGGPNQRGSSGDLMLPSAVVQLLPTPTVADSRGTRNATANRTPGGTASIGWTLSDVAYSGRLPSTGDGTPPPSDAGNTSPDGPPPPPPSPDAPDNPASPRASSSG